jgi:hypothetical protein
VQFVDRCDLVTLNGEVEQKEARIGPHRFVVLFTLDLFYPVFSLLDAHLINEPPLAVLLHTSIDFNAQHHSNPILRSTYSC